LHLGKGLSKGGCDSIKIGVVMGERQKAWSTLPNVNALGPHKREE
jgi:hypothetical protein